MAEHGAAGWRDVAADLRTRIRAGEWPVGARLPSHAALAEHYGVAVSTVVKAMRSLREAGVLAGERGRGVQVLRVPDAGDTGVPGRSLEERVALLEQQLADHLRDGNHQP